MVKIRLTRTGRKGLASYRVIAVDSRKKRESKALEILGHYLPHSKDIKLDNERVSYWLSTGAQPTETVARLLVKQGIMDKKELPIKKYSNKPGEKSTERAEAKKTKAEAAKEEKAPAEKENLTDE